MEKDIFRFQISMNNRTFVHVFYSFADLLDKILNDWLLYSSFFLEERVHVTGGTVLHDQVDEFFIKKEAVEFGDIRVI